MTPWVGLSLMFEDDFRVAAAPLFAAGDVDVLEWSFDTGPRLVGAAGDRGPSWAEALLDHYAAEGRLFGHGVHYSPFSARWEERQQRWLEALGRELARRRYVHVSEHYGFMTAAPFVRGAPLPVPRDRASLDVGRERLDRMRAVLASAGGCRLGLENLALAWSRDEALAHGAFLDDVLTCDDDFIVLDVHNLYCQAENFGLSPDELFATFPAARVGELHVSGGSVLSAWPGGGGEVRCDTHDHAVPAPVFDLLDRALGRFPNVRAVVFERLGGTIRSAEQAEELRRDFRQVKAIATRPRRFGEEHASTDALRDSTSRPAAPAISAPPRLPSSSRGDVEALAVLQSALLDLLDRESDESIIRAHLEVAPAFAEYRDEVRAFDGRALGIAARIVKKWGRKATTHAS
ncbi:MAG: DUF692 family protein [Labilithrix sp.]|nr:DUF692 family protein [Labilithrix sp.]